MTFSQVRGCFWKGRASGLLVAGLAAAQLCAGPAHADPLKPSAIFELAGDLVGKKGRVPATDISGIACMDPPGSTTQRCLVVNDENQSAQFVTIKGTKIAVGSPVPLVGNGPDPATVGVKPDVSCPRGTGEFGEFDGEGVAYSEPFFYVAGSHGCSRNSRKFRLSSFLLARIRVDKDGRVVDRNGQLPAAGTDPLRLVETTYRLTDLLRQAPEVGSFLGKDLNGANGLNIEGIAVVGDKLLVGLRAPSSQAGKAYLVSASLAGLFAPGHATGQAHVEVIALPFGKPLGVRDLAALPDGRVLVLAGPAQEQDLAYGFFVVEPRRGGAFAELGTIEKVEEGKTAGKAEAVTVLDAGSGSLRLLVLFDALKNGGPREYRVPFKN